MRFEIKTFIIFLSSLFLCLPVNSQNTDSIIKVLAQLGDDSNKVNTLNLLAKTLEYSDSEKSIKYIKEAILLSESINYKKGLAKAYLNKGNYHFHKADYNTALDAYNSALLISKSINNLNGMASAYTGIGLVHTYTGEYNKAIEGYFKGLEIKEKSGNMQGQAILLSNIGELYMYQEQYDKALLYHNKSAEIEKKLNNEQGLAESYNNLAGVYFYLKKPELSLDFYNYSITLAKKLGDKALLARGLNNIGCIYQSLNKHEKAIEYLTNSLKLREEIGDINGMASSYNALGKSFQMQKKYQAAISYTEKSLEIATEIDAKKTRMENFSQLSEIYKATKNFEKSLFCFQKAQEIKDTLQKNDLAKNIVEIETKYQTDKKEKEIKLLTQANKIQDLELNKNKITIYATAAVIVLLLVLAATIFKRYQLKQKANKIITEQKALVEFKQKEILDSINYAKKIQYTLIAHDDFLKAHLKDYFIFYKPKDIVSGDFYWATKKEDDFYLAVCDSTGHGVPGAFMSLLNIGFLNEAINEKNIKEPDKILNHVREKLIQNLNKDNQKDGFDGTLIRINNQTNILSYASAYNNPILIKENNLTELPADNMPVGIGDIKDSFHLNYINDAKNGMLYLFTDGYADQFGGPQGKKLKYRKFYELLVSVSHLSMPEQQRMLSDYFDEWKGHLEQIDDVCVVGLRI